MSHSPEFLVLSEKLLPDVNFSAEAHHKAEFIQQASPYISHLLDSDFQKLVQIMYRIDVSEKEFALTLQPASNNDITKSLAELIYDRLLIKAQYRAKYKEN
ncbi:hypothetical protein GCM10011506_32050 [Marivirga lumbricoides]|uniref:Uncharacterized protein n=1 Tax=Marivirga lumbricoides TaxID=1046115 RepID=A0A2T4DSR2_9BACT|nr:hypothetical protein C9994_05310 [Marivirga lumbricoides]GGC44076.1 hypothetical protein GCM10011506_32050 [Marivirga lumbricoides]